MLSVFVRSFNVTNKRWRKIITQKVVPHGSTCGWQNEEKIYWSGRIHIKKQPTIFFLFSLRAIFTVQIYIYVYRVYYKSLNDFEDQFISYILIDLTNIFVLDSRQDTLLKYPIEISMARAIEERVSMVRLFSKYENAHEIQRQWKYHFNTFSPGLATITAVNQRFNKTGSVEDLPCTGRPATALTEKLEEIQDMVDTNPRLSIRQDSIEAAAVAEFRQF